MFVGLIPVTYVAKGRHAIFSIAVV